MSVRPKLDATSVAAIREHLEGLIAGCERAIATTRKITDPDAREWKQNQLRYYRAARSAYRWAIYQAGRRQVKESRADSAPSQRLGPRAGGRRG